MVEQFYQNRADFFFRAGVNDTSELRVRRVATIDNFCVKVAFVKNREVTPDVPINTPPEREAVYMANNSNAIFYFDLFNIR